MTEIQVLNSWASCGSNSRASGRIHRFCERSAHRGGPRSGGIAQPRGWGSKGVETRAGEYKWMMKSVTRVRWSKTSKNGK